MNRTTDLGERVCRGVGPPSLARRNTTTTLRGRGRLPVLILMFLLETSVSPIPDDGAEGNTTRTARFGFPYPSKPVPSPTGRSRSVGEAEHPRSGNPIDHDTPYCLRKFGGPAGRRAPRTEEQLPRWKCHNAALAGNFRYPARWADRSAWPEENVECLCLALAEKAENKGKMMMTSSGTKTESGNGTVAKPNRGGKKNNGPKGKQKPAGGGSGKKEKGK